MTNQITLEQALKLVSFKEVYGVFVVEHVLSSVHGDVRGSVYGSVHGSVCGTIRGRPWEFVETPKQRLKRLIESGADKEQLIEVFNQL